MWIPRACGGGLEGRATESPVPAGSDRLDESAPGIRMKAIRDGMQDYEYAPNSQKPGTRTFTNSVIQPIAASWTNWNHNPSALEAARLQLGHCSTSSLHR